ncbi:MAG: NAD(P)-dependent oxidoreductase [Blastomonas fulva]|uniref:NAD-dependent epimerase/dehydratase family protein n=1 Tax=Blastomonas fulva TaxID=1550728 RepID=UPI0024E1C6B0|nr:NAD(P)-dependent oxidoreductase [Blastomonas fulva]MDK2759455.1 NAD(P)-dependent oxidoreductase [Blastomonas fulva]
MYVVVTGSAGKLGRVAMQALRNAGHRVVGLDIAGPIEPAKSLRCDCTDLGQIMDALSGIDITGRRPDAIVHLAGIPMPGLATDQKTFQVNTLATYNVFTAAARLGIRNVVWASSETILGLPFDNPPDFVPINEDHPDRPNWSYALSKQLGEQMADSFCRWDPEMKIVSLRFSNVFAQEDYAQVPAIQANPRWRKMNLWSYIDAADAADACTMAVTTGIKGHHRLIIAARDTLMDIDSAELMRRYYPEVAIHKPLEGNQSLLDNARAQAVIGFSAKRGWHTIEWNSAS